MPERIHYANLLIIVIAALWAVSCGGGGTTDVQHFGGNSINNDQGLQANLRPPANPDDVPKPQPILGGGSFAPLGTDPQYETQELSDTIVTTFLGAGTSSVRSSSQDVGDRLFWLSVVHRGDPPIEGVVADGLAEGTEIDLYLHYEIYASELTVGRNWYIEAASLDYFEPAVEHPQAGIYEAKLEFTIPYGSAHTEAKFQAAIVPPRETSVFSISDEGDFRELGFNIAETALMAPIYYPAYADEENDEQGGKGGCLPDTAAEFIGASVSVSSTKALSNVVLEFDDGVHQKWDNLDQGKTGTFYGTGENYGKTIVRCWVKSGCNASGDGPGYGEKHEPEYKELEMAQFGWEDLLTNADYDYNDFVGRMRVTEFRNLSNEIVQIHLTVKAVARSAGYDSDWQFNIGAAFPDNVAYTIVDQYFADGTRHGDQRIYKSVTGISVPVFSPIRDALPEPPGSYATNGIPGTRFIDGDYAEVTVLLENPMPQGSYTPLPYEPELRVEAVGGVYIIRMWRQPGDPVDSTGHPLAFIVPDTYAWALEGEPIEGVYSGFDDWIEWINGGASAEPTPVWYDLPPVQGFFDSTLFN